MKTISHQNGFSFSHNLQRDRKHYAFQAKHDKRPYFFTGRFLIHLSLAFFIYLGSVLLINGLLPMWLSEIQGFIGFIWRLVS